MAFGAIKRKVAKSTKPYQVVVGTTPPPSYLRPLKQPLYDTMQYPAAGVNALSFFQVPQGQALVAGVNKTAVHTNLTQAGQLGTPQQFDLFGFQCKLPVVTINADWDALIANGVFTFSFGQNRQWLTVPLAYVPAGISKDGYAATTVGATTIESHHNGQGLISNYLNFTVGNNPIRIHSNESFNVTLTWPTVIPTPTVAVNITVYLLGILYSGL